MSADLALDEELAGRLPLPLAQLYRRVHNAREPLERHLFAYYLWEAALKLLASVAVVEYAELAAPVPEFNEHLRHLARQPALRHWWEIVRMLVPVLAGCEAPGFRRLFELLAQPQPGFPRAAMLQEACGRGAGAAPADGPGLGELFKALIDYRNRELGHGVDRQREPAFYERMGGLLLGAAAEVLGRLDVLAGRRLVYLADLRPPAGDNPVVDAFELIGEVPQRLDPSALVGERRGPPPCPGRLCFLAAGGGAAAIGPFRLPGLLPLEPLVRYDPDTGEVHFFNRGRGERPPEYLCYTTGRFTSHRYAEGALVPVLSDLLDVRPPETAPAPAAPPSPEPRPRRRGFQSLRDEGPRGPSSTSGSAGITRGRRPAYDPDALVARQVREEDTACGATAPPVRRVGEFEVLEPVGRGAFCEVYRARQPMMDRLVALKVTARADDPAVRQQVLREIRILGRVQHPNLVQIYASGAEPDCLFYATEWVQGTTLRAVLTRLEATGRGPAELDLRGWQKALCDAAGTRPPDNLDALAGAPCFGRIAELLRQVAGAAHALHQAGFVHRDIKPDNILVTADGARAVLTGLDCVKEGVTEGGLTRERGFVGTVAYASPEQVEGVEQRLGGRSDVYSIGVVLWELLSLRRMRPHRDNVAEMLQRALHDEPEPIRKYNPRVPRDLEAICRRCLHLDRERRYPSAQALAEALEKFLHGEPVMARKAGFSLRRWFGRLVGQLGRPWPKRREAAPAPVAPVPIAPAPAAEETQPVPVAPTRPAPRQPAAPAAVPAAPDQAFSAQTIVTLYPAPIALAYRRFCQETHPRSRLEALFFVLEASVRYLLTLAVSDLFHCLATSGRDGADLLGHADLTFLRRPQPMLLGKWVGALREAARALGNAGQEGRVIAELPALCKAGDRFDAGLLGPLVQQRNDCTHPDGSIRIPDQQCRDVLREYRPRLEEALREIRFVCRYPLGFVSAFGGLPGARGLQYYHLHSCMGAWVGGTSRALDVKTAAVLQEDMPFVAAPDGRRLLYLWPLLLERRSAYTGRRTLWILEQVADKRRFLTRARMAAIDVPESWEPELNATDAASHAWLLERLRALPPAPEVPAELRLAERLLPTAGGRLVGQALGSNRLLSVVALGGFGTVYAAEAEDGQRVAVKVVEAHLSATQLKRFYLEIDKLRLTADNPGIVRLHEHGDVDVDGRIYPWYSMEFAFGGDLRGRIDKRRGLLQGGIPWDDPAARAEVCAEFTQVAKAIAHLHRLQIVHRDIKPGNVLIMADGSLRLSDFGLVKSLGPSEKSLRRQPNSEEDGVMGTPGYMAPEQARGQEVGTPADTYALGILLAELALGERPKAELPADGAGPAGPTLKRCKALARLPAGLRSLLERCTDADPERRPADAGCVLHAFNEVVAKLPPPGASG